MITKWTQHLTDPKDKESFERQILNSKAVFERLQQILKEELAHLDDTETSVKAYENPNWSYLQADKNGFRRAIKIINKLIDLDQKGIK